MSDIQEAPDTKSDEATTAAPAVAAPVRSSESVSEGKPTVFMGFTLGQAIFAISWPLLVLVGLYAFLLAPRLEAIEAGVRARPAIKVVNVTEVVRRGVESGMDANDAINRADAQFRKLASEGYIVLNNNDVLAAPKDARLP